VEGHVDRVPAGPGAQLGEEGKPIGSPVLAGGEEPAAEKAGRPHGLAGDGLEVCVSCEPEGGDLGPGNGRAAQREQGYQRGSAHDVLPMVTPGGASRRFAGRITDRSLRVEEGKSGGNARQGRGRVGLMQPFSAFAASKSVTAGSSPPSRVKPILFVARRDR